MKFLVIGAGGTGGCIGGYLAKLGEDVTFIARGKHLEAMRRNGLQVKSARVGDFLVKPVKACTMEEYDEVPDVVFICVKYYSLAEAVDFLKPIVGKDTIVIPILNVYGTGEKIQPELECTVTDGCVYIFSMIEAPGVINQPTPIFRMFFGLREASDGAGGAGEDSGEEGEAARRMEERLQAIEQTLNRAGIEAHKTEHIRKDALQKFSFVSPMGAAGLYYDGVAADFMEAGEKRQMFFDLVREVEAVGQAMGITFDVNLAENAGNILGGLTPDATTSMQRDVAAGGKSEVDGLVHEMVRLGEAYHVDVPNYRRISEWAKARGIE